MITIPRIGSSPQRQLTADEKATVIAVFVDDDEFKYYQQGDTLPVEEQAITPPNWNGLTQSLWSTPALMGKAMTSANPNVYSTLLKVLTDGEINSASEAAFLQMFNMLGIAWTQTEKDLINSHLSDNNFTIRIL